LVFFYANKTIVNSYTLYKGGSIEVNQIIQLECACCSIRVVAPQLSCGCYSTVFDRPGPDDRRVRHEENVPLRLMGRTVCRFTVRSTVRTSGLVIPQHRDATSILFYSTVRISSVLVDTVQNRSESLVGMAGQRCIITVDSMIRS
jgi:hypothetical protein